MNPGPGSYFNNKYKYDFIKQNNKNKIIKNKNNRNEHIIENKNINKKNKSSLSLLGPGSYNLIKKQFTKKSFNSFGNFSNEKRRPGRTPLRKRTRLKMTRSKNPSIRRPRCKRPGRSSITTMRNPM